MEEGQATAPRVAAEVPGGGVGGGAPLGARMPGGACQGSELRGGGGRWGPRQRAAQGSRETLAPLGPPSRRVRPRWLFCAAAAHRGGGRVSSPPWPALASILGPRGQLQCPSVSKCPPAAQPACESSDSTFKQRGRGFKPHSCLLQDLQTSQGRREGRDTHICARKGGGGSGFLGTRMYSTEASEHASGAWDCSRPSRNTEGQNRWDPCPSGAYTPAGKKQQSTADPRVCVKHC